jgi:hypothetical protein
MKNKKRYSILLYLLISLAATLSLSCTKDKKLKSSTNHLSFKIDGVYWQSKEDEVFGSYHFNETLGPKLIQIAGSKGDAPNDQPFNINIYNTATEGTYTFNQDNADNSVVQIAQLTASNYLCGGTFQDYNFTIVITKVSKNPQIVEATFSGTMQCVEGNTINITDGKFYYHE